MRADGGQLSEITALIDNGIIRPVVDRVFPFASTKEAVFSSTLGERHDERNMAVIDH
jgi:NADPH:quinone reductase-like Zn-dependent oxidoreductase